MPSVTDLLSGLTETHVGHKNAACPHCGAGPEVQVVPSPSGQSVLYFHYLSDTCCQDRMRNQLTMLQKCQAQYREKGQPQEAQAMQEAINKIHRDWQNKNRRAG